MVSAYFAGWPPVGAEASLSRGGHPSGDAAGVQMVDAWPLHCDRVIWPYPRAGPTGVGPALFWRHRHDSADLGRRGDGATEVPEETLEEENEAFGVGFAQLLHRTFGRGITALATSWARGAPMADESSDRRLSALEVERVVQ